MAYDEDYYERTARFVDWLERQRELAGLSPERLVELGGGIKLWTYRRLTSFRNVWRQRGNADGKLDIPVKPESMVRVLKVLSNSLGEDCVEEASRVWGVSFPDIGGLPSEEAQEAGDLMEVAIHALIGLPPSKLRTIIEVARSIR